MQLCSSVCFMRSSFGFASLLTVSTSDSPARMKLDAVICTGQANLTDVLMQLEEVQDESAPASDTAPPEAATFSFSVASSPEPAAGVPWQPSWLQCAQHYCSAGSPESLTTKL